MELFLLPSPSEVVGGLIQVPFTKVVSRLHLVRAEGFRGLSMLKSPSREIRKTTENSRILKASPTSRLPQCLRVGTTFSFVFLWHSVVLTRSIRRHRRFVFGGPSVRFLVPGSFKYLRLSQPFSSWECRVGVSFGSFSRYDKSSVLPTQQMSEENSSHRGYTRVRDVRVSTGLTWVEREKTDVVSCVDTKKICCDLRSTGSTKDPRRRVFSHISPLSLWSSNSTHFRGERNQKTIKSSLTVDPKP